jgi:C4-type Zn-finger protein
MSDLIIVKCKCLADHGTHDFDWDKSSQTCSDCDMREGDVVYRQAKQIKIMTSALNEIRNIDFRGNRSTESQIAYLALREIEELNKEEE